MKIIRASECYNIIGACMEVHNNLGPGLKEVVYQEALEIELGLRKIPFQREKRFPIYYKERKLSKYFVADFSAYNDIIIELKARTELSQQDKSQALNYVTISNASVGLLVNFGSKSLVHERFVGFNQIQHLKKSDL